MANKHAIVRTDRLFGTDNRAGLISIRYMGADGSTPTEIDNGHILKVGMLAEGEREVFVGKDVAQTDPMKSIALVVSPEVMYDERLNSLDDYYNEAGKICRAYRLHDGDIFSVTKEALDGEESPAVGDIVELKAGTMLNVAKSATEGATTVGRIITVETVGRFTYYVILVSSSRVKKPAPAPVITGADRVKVTPQETSLSDYGVGEKLASELIGADATIEWDGTNGSVKGTIKNIKDAWEAFDTNPDNNTGHFFPVELDEQYEGEKITVIGQRQKTVADRKWVLRVENAKSSKFTFKKGSDTLFVLDFSGATLDT